MLKPFYKRPAAILLGLATATAGGIFVKHEVDVRHEREELKALQVKDAEIHLLAYDLEGNLASHQAVVAQYWVMKQRGTTEDEFVKSYADHAPEHDKTKARIAYDAIVGWGDAVEHTVITGLNQTTPTDTLKLASATANLAQVQESVIATIGQPLPLGKNRLSRSENSAAIVEVTLAKDDLKVISVLYDNHRDPQVLSALKQTEEFKQGIRPEQRLPFEVAISEPIILCSEQIKLEIAIASSVLRAGVGTDQMTGIQSEMLAKASRDKDGALLLLDTVSENVKVLLDSNPRSLPHHPPLATPPIGNI